MAENLEQITIAVPPADAAWLREQAAKCDRSVSGVVRRFVSLQRQSGCTFSTDFTPGTVPAEGAA